MTDQAPELLPNERDRIARIIYDTELARENKPPIPDGSWEKIKPLARFHFAAADAILTRPTPSEPVATAENAIYQKIVGRGVDALENRKEQQAERPVAQMREALNQIIETDDLGHCAALARDALAALTSERPSEAAVAWRFRDCIDDQWTYLDHKPDAEHREVQPLYAIQHGDAVPAALTRIKKLVASMDPYKPMSGERAQEIIETCDLALSPTLASGRVSKP